MTTAQLTASIERRIAILQRRIDRGLATERDRQFLAGQRARLNSLAGVRS